MPTETQRNFRKQMKEIEKEKRRRGEVDKYRPPKRVSFPSSRQKSGTNYVIGILLLLIVALPSILSIVKHTPKIVGSSINKNLDTKHKSKSAVHEYITLIKPLIFRKSEILEELNILIDKSNRKELTEAQELTELDNIKQKMFKLQNDLNIIKPPFEIISVHSLISSEVYCYINGLECLSNGIANKNQSSHHFELYRTYFRDGHEKNARFIDEIVIIFEDLGIKYTRFEGGVQYTID